MEFSYKNNIFQTIYLIYLIIKYKIKKIENSF